MDHPLTPFFPDLSKFKSTRAMKSSFLYSDLRSEIKRVLETIVVKHLSRTITSTSQFIRVTAWNIERGLKLEGLLNTLRNHPILRKSDVLLLTELDWGMARTGNRLVAQEIAKSLGLNFAFSPCYIALDKGSGLEHLTPGTNMQALHGNAVFSKFPISEVQTISLPNGKDLMRGKEKRLGCQRAILATINHPSGSFKAVTLHLDAHSSQKHRWRQMKLVLNHLNQHYSTLPVLIGGDWNTSTYNSRRAFYAILGYTRRVAMGVQNVIKNHYPYPDRWFERHLFRELRKHGYKYNELNDPGVCTLHYNVEDLPANHRMADWIPNWCFWFIKRALQSNNGKCSMKLDWFAGKGLSVYPRHSPRVIQDVHQEEVLSDHDPIVLDFQLSV